MSERSEAAEKKKELEEEEGSVTGDLLCFPLFL